MSMMIFIFLCFFGLFIMFFYLIRSQEKTLNILQQEMRKTTTQLRLLEKRLARALGEEEAEAPLPTAEARTFTDPLSSLSMGNEEEQPKSNGLELRF